MQNAIFDVMEKFRDEITLGEVPEEIYDIVADAMDIIAPDLGPRLPPEAGAMLMGILAMHLVAEIRAIDSVTR
jgi:hypothetical protein